MQILVYSDCYAFLLQFALFISHLQLVLWIVNGVNGICMVNAVLHVEKELLRSIGTSQ